MVLLLNANKYALQRHLCNNLRTMAGLGFHQFGISVLFSKH